MKKLITVFLVIIMILPTTAMADLDVSSMTDQELKELISTYSAELRKRATVEPEGILIFECEGIKVYQTEDAYITSAGSLYVKIAIYNNLDKDISLSPDRVICNGWEIYSGSCSALANSNHRETLSFNVKDAGINSIDQIDSLSFIWVVYTKKPFEIYYEQETTEEHRFW